MREVQFPYRATISITGCPITFSLGSLLFIQVVFFHTQFMFSSLRKAVNRVSKGHVCCNFSFTTCQCLRSSSWPRLSADSHACLVRFFCAAFSPDKLDSRIPNNMRLSRYLASNTKLETKGQRNTGAWTHGFRGWLQDKPCITVYEDLSVGLLRRSLEAWRRCRRCENV